MTLLLLNSACATSKSPQATVHVRLQHTLGPNSPLLHGGNNIYPQKAQGLWDSETQQADPLHLQKAASLGVRTYRFPGGSEGNLYHWKRAIGPLAERIDNVSGNNQGPQANHFGSDEFGRLLASGVFTDGIVMVPYAYEKPDDVADWVEYMNSPVGKNPNGGVDWAAVRASHGHPEPYNIRHWEIGNEVYGNWELNWGSYPPVGDAKRGSANVEFDEVTNVAGTLPFGDADRYIFGGSKYFKNQKAAAKTSWRDAHIRTDGAPSQTLYVKFPPIDLSHPDKPLRVNIAGKTWQRVENFNQSTPTDNHFVVEPVAGTIQFGDGTRGRIPPVGEFVYLDYLSGPQPGFVDYYRKMKAVDPTITIISCFEKASFYRHMAKHRLPFDGVTKHYYPWGFRGVPRADRYSASIVNGIDIGIKVEDHKRWLEQYPNPALQAPVKLWISEYAANNLPTNAAVYHTLINHYLNDIGTLLIHSLFLNNNTPIINDDGRIRGKGLAIAAFSALSLDTFVDTRVEGDSYKWRYRGEVTELPPVLATASVDRQQQAVAVVLTNTREHQAVDVRVALEDFATFSDKPLSQYRLETWHLGSRTKDALADNTREHPERTGIDGPKTLPMRTPVKITVPAGKVVVVTLQPG